MKEISKHKKGTKSEFGSIGHTTYQEVGQKPHAPDTMKGFELTLCPLS